MTFAAGFRRRRIVAIGGAIGEVPEAENGQYSRPLRQMIVNGTLRRYLDTGVQLTIDRGK
jgi:hypothetical protein